MKLIFITREGYNQAGARVRCYNFARELAKQGIETEVLSFCDHLGAKDGQAESQLSARDKIRLNLAAWNRVARAKGTVLFIQRSNYHSLFAYFANLFGNAKVILDLDDWEMRENPKYYFGFYPNSKAHYLTREIAKRSLFCIAASKFLQEFLSKFNKKVYYLPSGVDTNLFIPSRNGLRRDKLVFSWIGTFNRVEYAENIRFALECFGTLRRKYPHIYFDILGTGIYKNPLEKTVRDFNDPQVQIRHWIHPDIVPEYLSGIHIGLLPVVQDNQFNRAKSPTKLFEYMSMGKATVSSNIGETAHIIRDGENGLLAKTKEEFMAKMEILIQDEGLRNRISKNA